MMTASSFWSPPLFPATFSIASYIFPPPSTNIYIVFFWGQMCLAPGPSPVGYLKWQQTLPIGYPGAESFRPSSTRTRKSVKLFMDICRINKLTRRAEAGDAATKALRNNFSIFIHTLEKHPKFLA